MPRCVSVVPMVHAGVVAVVIALNSGAAVAAATDCLAAPNRAPAAGEHWFFHTERDTNRKCWYLRDGAVATTGSVAASRTPPDAAPPDRGAAAPLSQGEQEALFEDFLRWRRQHRETQ